MLECVPQALASSHSDSFPYAQRVIYLLYILNQRNLLQQIFFETLTLVVNLLTTKKMNHKDGIPIFIQLSAVVSNSASYAGHILTKEGLAGCIKRKNVSAGHNRRPKVPLYYKNISFNNNLSNFNDVAGRKKASGGPHTACRPRV